MLESLSDTPVVLLHGARQTGKSTLVRWLASGAHPARYLTLDDAGVLAATRSDPAGFLAGLEGPVILDEVQRVPELFPAIKLQVDRHRRSGQFLLTGSSNVMLLPRLSESLAGRIDIHTLWPLSQGEIEGIKEGFVDAIFGSDLPTVDLQPLRRGDLLGRILRGGYPEAYSRASDPRRNAWVGSYVTTILQRDIRDIANVADLAALPRLLQLLSSRVSGLVNFAELSRSLAIPQSSLRRYTALLEATFLLQMLPAWSANLGKRLVRAPKLLIADTGLMAHQLGLDAEQLTASPDLLGPVLENFVAMEIMKQIAWSRTQPRLFHFRSHAGHEVDLVLEDRGGRIVGIEVKAGATVTARDLRGLRSLAEGVGKRFHRGIVLYTGSELIPFGRRLHALPVNAPWHLAGTAHQK